eukprot:1158628-Pelagomonas_calceolata.AAC.4
MWPVWPVTAPACLPPYCRSFSCRGGGSVCAGGASSQGTAVHDTNHMPVRACMLIYCRSVSLPWRRFSLRRKASRQGTAVHDTNNMSELACFRTAGPEVCHGGGSVCAGETSWQGKGGAGAGGGK